MYARNLDSIATLTASKPNAAPGGLVFQTVYHRSFRRLAAEVGDDVTQDAALHVYKKLRTLGRMELITMYEDSLRRVGGYLRRAAWNQLYTEKRRGALERLVLMVDLGHEHDGEPADARFADPFSSATERVDLLGIRQELARLWLGAGLGDRRALLFRLANNGLRVSAVELQKEQSLDMLAADPSLRQLAFELFGTEDLLAIRPATWGRAGRDVAWSAGTVGGGLARAEDLIREVLAMPARVPVRRPRGGGGVALS